MFQIRRAKAIPIPLRVAFPSPHRLLLLLALLALAAAAAVGGQRDAGASSAAPSDGSNPDVASVATTDLIVLGKSALAGLSGQQQAEPTTETGGTLQEAATRSSPSGGRGAQAVSSVTFVQLHTPFVWGRVSVGGLSVQLTLEDGGGNLEGVPSQTYLAPPNNQVKIDINQLYYETVFVDPNDPAHPAVMIRPGDRVHVATTGTDPGTNLPATEDKRILVDDVRAWTSYEQDEVRGTTTATPGTDVVVTSGGRSIAQYLTPGGSMTYAELVVGADGSFRAPTFRTTADPTFKKVDLKQGSTGFVRVRQPDGNEVYTVHGQNVFVLENADLVHGYAFKLPSPPSGPAGTYASGPIQCGTTNRLALRPGSFGYVGYEDTRGNFVYLAFAAPVTQVMSDYPFLEGWVADGTVRPTVTLRGADGATKEQTTTDPFYLYSTTDRLFFNTYYNLTTAHSVVPGDTVTVQGGGRTHTVPVDRVSAFVDVDTDAVTGEAPAGAGVRIVPADDRASRREVVAGAGGTYSAGNPFTSLNDTTCGEAPRTLDFTPGDAGRAYVRHADGDEVFAAYGRAMHVYEHDNYAEFYLYTTRDLDWYATPRRTASVTPTPRQGTPTTLPVLADSGRPGKTKVYLIDAQGQKVVIRGGDRLSATFDEGPDGATRSTTIVFDAMPLVTASPDVETSTVAGVGPRAWGGRVTLNPPPTARPVPLTPRVYTAYGPVGFATTSNSPVPLVQGYSGAVSFSDAAGHRVQTAWAVTAYPVKITGRLRVGDTTVCGTAAAGTTVRIHDVTADGQDAVVGTGTTDAQKRFCVSVPALYAGQVILAEADGTFSQPVLINPYTLFVPIAPRVSSPN